MPGQTEARDEALRRAREGARVVLAKHPCVVAGAADHRGRRVGGADGDRRCVDHAVEQAGTRPGAVEIRIRDALRPGR